MDQAALASELQRAGDVDAYPQGAAPINLLAAVSQALNARREAVPFHIFQRHPTIAPRLSGPEKSRHVGMTQLQQRPHRSYEALGLHAVCGKSRIEHLQSHILVFPKIAGAEDRPVEASAEQAPDLIVAERLAGDFIDPVFG